NLIISPLSIFVALSMVMCGANGKTLLEMSNALSYGDSDFSQVKDNQLKQFIDGIVEHLSYSENTLSLANNIYISNSIELQDAFKNTMKEIFKADLKQTDFTHSTKAANEINEWVSEKTAEKIKDLINPSSINASTKLILVNAITFFGSWKNTFDIKQTDEDGEFYTVNGVVKSVPLMKKRFVKLPYGEDDSYKWVTLEYSEYNFAMKLFLPKTPNTKVSDKVESKFDEWITKKLSQRSNLSKFPTSEKKLESFILPRFEAEYSSSLNEILQKAPFSMTSAFSAGADFSQMDKNNSVMIDKVFHKAVIKVNEEGTEAAAATYVSMRAKSKKVKKEVVYSFKADQPFFYMITYKDHILFLG
ncbi:predicted protein, partial [Naegleria gruberi]